MPASQLRRLPQRPTTTGQPVRHNLSHQLLGRLRGMEVVTLNPSAPTAAGWGIEPPAVSGCGSALIAIPDAPSLVSRPAEMRTKSAGRAGYGLHAQYTPNVMAPLQPYLD